MRTSNVTNKSDPARAQAIALTRSTSEFKIASGAVLLALVFAAGAAMADGKDERASLKMLGSCPGCSFETLDLEGRKLVALDVRRSTFTNVSFEDAEMNLAIFDDAILKNVSFASADLGGASFSGARMTNVTFDGAEMTAAVFEDAILIDTNLQAGLLCNTQMPDQSMDNSDCD
jgi:uncharacterized protein YjbI with pentapeptide repeats